MKRKSRSWRISTLTLVSALVIGPVHAQEDLAITGDEREVEEITVTGMSSRRSQAVRIGIADTTEMIAESPAVFGTQLDGSVNSGSTTGAVEGVGRRRSMARTPSPVW